MTPRRWPALRRCTHRWPGCDVRRAGRHEAGSAGLFAVWAVSVVLAGTLGVLGWAAAVETRQRADAAADLSALSAAQAASRGDAACQEAAEVAAAMNAQVSDCVVDTNGTVDLAVEVAVPASWLRVLDVPPARARARAGVPMQVGAVVSRR